MSAGCCCPCATISPALEPLALYTSHIVMGITMCLSQDGTGLLSSLLKERNKKMDFPYMCWTLIF